MPGLPEVTALVVTALRKKMVQQLVMEESKHEAVEEMYFWPAVREALTDGSPGLLKAAGGQAGRRAACRS